jgi:hypothetical protein
MKSLVKSTTLSCLTFAFLALTAALPVQASLSPETIYYPQEENTDFDTTFSQVSEAQQIAYSYCYYEYYSDGSYAWVCW